MTIKNTGSLYIYIYIYTRFSARTTTNDNEVGEVSGGAGGFSPEIPIIFLVFWRCFMNKKDYLEYLKSKNLSKETRRTYYLRLKYYAKNKNNPENIESKDRKYINQIKQAVKYYYNMQDIYYNDDTKYISKLHDNAKKRNKKLVETLYLKQTNQKINLLQDKRKKLAFRLQEISGLRIAEIADLKKEDLEFCDKDKIIVTVKNGKGDKERTLKSFNNKYAWENLRNLQDRKGRLFYSKYTLMKEAKKLGFNTHRLRKVFAETLYLKLDKKEKERIEILQKCLGHETNEKNRTYQRYVKNTNINYTGTKFDI
jgi:integrase